MAASIRCGADVFRFTWPSPRMLIGCGNGDVTTLQRDRNRIDLPDECPAAASSNVIEVKSLELAE